MCENRAGTQEQADLASAVLQSGLREQMLLLFSVDEGASWNVLGAGVGPTIGWTGGACSQGVYGTLCTAVGQLFLQNSNYTAKGQTSHKKEIGDLPALMSLEYISNKEMS